MALSPAYHGLLSHAVSVAQSLGHRLDPWERVDLHETVTYCKSCGLAAVVNANAASKGGSLLGSTFVVECRGPSTAPSWA